MDSRSQTQTSVAEGRRFLRQYVIKLRASTPPKSVLQPHLSETHPTHYRRLFYLTPGTESNPNGKRDPRIITIYPSAPPPALRIAATDQPSQTGDCGRDSPRTAACGLWICETGFSDRPGGDGKKARFRVPKLLLDELLQGKGLLFPLVVGFSQRSAPAIGMVVEQKNVRAGIDARCRLRGPLVVADPFVHAALPRAGRGVEVIESPAGHGPAALKPADLLL